MKKENAVFIRYVYFLGINLIASGFGFVGYSYFKGINPGTFNIILFGGVIPLIGIGIVALMHYKKLTKEDPFDERMTQARDKSIVIAWGFVYLSLLIIIMIDYIKPITMPYHTFLMYFMGAAALVQIVSYYVMLKIR